MTTIKQYPVFVYGSLRKGGVFHGVVSSYLEGSTPAFLYGMQMYHFGEFPTIAPDLNAETPVVGDLLYIRKEDWEKVIERLDMLESEGYLYNRMPLVVERLDKEIEAAWVYVLNQDNLPLVSLKKVESNNWK